MLNTCDLDWPTPSRYALSKGRAIEQQKYIVFEIVRARMPKKMSWGGRFVVGAITTRSSGGDAEIFPKETTSSLEWPMPSLICTSKRKGCEWMRDSVERTCRKNSTRFRGRLAGTVHEKRTCRPIHSRKHRFSTETLEGQRPTTIADSYRRQSLTDNERWTEISPNRIRPRHRSSCDPGWPMPLGLALSLVIQREGC